MDYENQLQELRYQYEKIKESYFSEKGRMSQLELEKDRLQLELQKVLNNMELLNQVRVLLQKVSEYAREESRRQIEVSVTQCLAYIFDSDLEFKIEIKEVRGKPEAEFYVINNQNGSSLKTKPQEARGGGVVDIISLALRVAMLQCSSIKIDGPLILDEPAKHVSEGYITHVGEFLRQVTKTFGRQVIMVTHDRHLSEIADKAYRIELKEGISNTIIDS